MATPETAPVEDFKPIVEIFAELDQIIVTAANKQMVGIAPISLRSPVTEPPIHAFYTTVSWLYVLIIEGGPIHFRFLSERAPALGIDATRELRRFCEDIQIFRTVLQHNLNLADANDLAKLVRYECWASDILGISLLPGDRFWPDTETQWHLLAQALRE